jgi:hypothetical protein
MGISRDVRIWNIQVKTSEKTTKKSYTVRWIVAGQEQSKTFASRALADNFRTDLKRAANAGEAFDVDMGLPESLALKATGVTWFEFVQRYVKMKWPDAAPKSRTGMVESLVAVTVVLVGEMAAAPNPDVLRATLRKQVLEVVDRRVVASPAQIRACLGALCKVGRRDAERGVRLKAFFSRSVLRRAAPG